MPLVVYGTTASYFTGKLEAYLRAKGLSYRLVDFTPRNMRRSARHTGVMQIPQVECADGRWLIDTSLIIEYLERVAPEPRITPADPTVAFVASLIEDYADEWLWRPAMHYRWSFPENARLMSAWLAEHLADEPGPEWLKRLWWRRRQRGTFVTGDGVTPATRAAVEATYLDTLVALEPVFNRRPFVLGERPTQADFGLFGPLFRHFFCDPAPARIMRERAPAVQEWVARLWNIKPQTFAAASLPETLPDDLEPLLRDVVGNYLPYLNANAEAYAAGQRRVRYTAGGATFSEPVKPYRVWCRDRLHDRYAALDRGRLAAVGCPPELVAALEILARPSPKPAPDQVGSLPLQPGGRSATVDSWWR